MKIKNNTVIELTESDVKDIIVEHFKKNGYDVSNENVTFSVGTRLEGYGMAEHQVTCFNGARVDCNTMSEEPIKIKKCKYCNGKGLVQIAPDVRGLKKCPVCTK